MSRKIGLLIIAPPDDAGWGWFVMALIVVGVALYVAFFVLTFAFLFLQVILIYTICWFAGVVVGHTAAVVAGMLRRNWHSPPMNLECNLVAFAAAGISVVAAVSILFLVTVQLGLYSHVWMPYRDNGFRLFPDAHDTPSVLAFPVVAVMALVMTYFAKPGDAYLMISQERVD